MAPFARTLDRVEHWWLAPRPIDALVAARLGLASVLFLAYAARLPVIADLFGPAGVGGAGLYARVPDLPRFHPGIAPAFDVLRFVHSDAAVLALYLALLFALAAFALGAWTRLAGFAAVALHLLFWARNPLAFTGWAAFATGPLLYVALAPVGRRWSVDAWLRRRSGEPAFPALASGWPLRLLQIHVCAMYAVAGWSRLDKPDWLDGSLVEIAMTAALTSRVAIDWSAVSPLLALATWAALILEGLAPILLWAPRIRRSWAAVLMLFHAALAPVLHVEVWAWSAVMITCLFAFLLPDEAPETTKG